MHDYIADFQNYILRLVEYAKTPSIWYNGIEYKWDKKQNKFLHWSTVNGRRVADEPPYEATNPLFAAAGVNPDAEDKPLPPMTTNRPIGREKEETNAPLDAPNNNADLTPPSSPEPPREPRRSLMLGGTPERVAFIFKISRAKVDRLIENVNAESLDDTISALRVTWVAFGQNEKNDRCRDAKLATNECLSALKQIDPNGGHEAISSRKAALLNLRDKIARLDPAYVWESEESPTAEAVEPVSAPEPEPQLEETQETISPLDTFKERKAMIDYCGSLTGRLWNLFINDYHKYDVESLAKMQNSFVASYVDKIKKEGLTPPSFLEGFNDRSESKDEWYHTNELIRARLHLLRADSQKSISHDIEKGLRDCWSVGLNSLEKTEKATRDMIDSARGVNDGYVNDDKMDIYGAMLDEIIAERRATRGSSGKTEEETISTIQKSLDDYRANCDSFLREEKAMPLIEIEENDLEKQLNNLYFQNKINASDCESYLNEAREIEKEANRQYIANLNGEEPTSEPVPEPQTEPEPASEQTLEEKLGFTPLQKNEVDKVLRKIGSLPYDMDYSGYRLIMSQKQYDEWKDLEERLTRQLEIEPNKELSNRLEKLSFELRCAKTRLDENKQKAEPKPEPAPESKPEPEPIRELSPLSENETSGETATEQRAVQKGADGYYPIDLDLARQCHENMSFRDFSQYQALSFYRAPVDEMRELAEKCKNKLSNEEDKSRIDGLLDAYERKLANWVDRYNRNGASCPSVMVTGASNFPVKKKERQLENLDTLMREHDALQTKYENAIRGTGTGGISSDDKNAVLQLETKLAKLETLHKQMLEANKYWRKNGSSWKGYDGPLKDEVARNVQTWGKDSHPMTLFLTTNSSAEIRRLKGRIEELKKKATSDYGNGWKFDGGRVVPNKDENRIEIFHDEKPDRATIDELKRNGFHWSPKKKAWQRMLNTAGIAAAKRLGYVPQDWKPTKIESEESSN